MCLLRIENVSLMHVWYQGGREGGKKRTEYTELFFFVWDANKREIKRKTFIFLENANRCF